MSSTHWQIISLSATAFLGLLGIGLNLVDPDEIQNWVPEALLSGAAVSFAIFLLTCIHGVSPLIQSLFRRFDTRKSVSTALPDWPIHELFYYLCPDLVDRPGELLWEKVGVDVREKFSMDENSTLRVSGILIEKDQMESWFGSNTRVLIPHTYWQHADFSYRFLEGEDGCNEPHTYDRRGKSGASYSDIKINKARALHVWPKPLDLKWQRPDYDLWDAKEHLRLSEAASLWIDEEPTARTGEMSPEAKAMYRQLADAIRKGELSAAATRDESIRMAFESHGMPTRDGDSAISVNTEVKREALREYALGIGQKPKFLFLGQRP